MNLALMLRNRAKKPSFSEKLGFSRGIISLIVLLSEI